MQDGINLNSTLQSRTAGIFFCVIALVLSGFGFAQALSEDALVGALREGGYIIVMRHASSPRQVPNANTARPDNLNRERQLDETGRNDAMAMGASVRRLDIPIAEVESSPAYRTLETARMMGFQAVQIREYLGNQGMSNSSEAFTIRLLENLENIPQRGNRLLVTHSPNIAAAFPELDGEVEQGEALVIDPEISIAEPVARIKIGTWPNLR